jgi:hypothetical protein
MGGRGRGANVLRFVVAIAVFVALVVSAPAFAAEQAIGVYVEGPERKPLRDAVIAALGGRVAVVDDKALRAELARAGQKRPFGTSMDARAIDRVRRAGRALGVECVLVVRERADKRSRRVLWTIVDVSGGSAEATMTALDPKSRASDSEKIAVALGASLEPYLPKAVEAPQTPPPPSPPLVPQGVGGPQPPEAAATTRVPVGGGRGAQDVLTPAQRVATSLLDVALAGLAAGRHFTYRNGISPAPSLYEAFPQLVVRASGRAFPLATLGRPWRDIGIAADFSRTFLQDSDLHGALTTTTPIAYGVGLCARAHAGEEARVLIGACVGYALTSFGSLGPSTAESPDVAYRSVRPALEGRLAFGDFAVFATAGARILVDTGNISTRLYNPRGFGLDGEAGVAWMFVRRFEWRVSARIEGYWLRLKPSAGENFGDGSSNDDLYGVGLTGAFVF